MMRAGRALDPILLAGVFCALAGCRRERAPPVSSEALVDAAASTSSDSGPRAGPEPLRPLQGGCRVMALSGDVRADGTPLAVEGEVPEEPQSTWLTLGPASKLAVKDARTTREVTLLGPGQARACVERREEAWLTSGALESEVGAGESPGAEEWVVTPESVVRYAAAKLRVEVRPKDTSVVVAAGAAFVWPAGGSRVVVAAASDASVGGAGDDGEWKRVASTTQATIGPGSVRPAAHSVDGARAALDQCEPLARRSRDLAAILLGGAGDAGGEVAAKQFETRRLARAACAVAELRIDSLPPAALADQPTLRSRLEAAAATWSSLPIVPLRR
ncbi:MAG TPA: hypothetical protein VKU41_24580 [Polyangiaceae bacterium]|nr:hypothetical protein [Polyangiaceae bacterium]